MFSPSYFRARRSELFPDPDAHCGINVALYGARERWAFTEPGPHGSHRTRGQLSLGGSSLRWIDGALHVQIDERTTGGGRPIRGTVRLTPGTARGTPIELDAHGRHQWWCVAPGARIEVDLSAPELRWSGSGYHDSNFGREPLEQAFAGWTWSRAETDQGTAVLYDARPRGGEPTERALLFRPDGSIASWEPAARSELTTTGWRVPRTIRSDAGHDRVIETLEDTPFYARSLVRTRRLGQDVTAVHEALDLDRFAHPIVQKMLPFRIRRGWRA